MGILNRVKSRVKGGIKKVVGGARAVHEEAKYPGRPASRHATESPLWQDPDVSRKLSAAAAAPPRAPEAVAPAPSAADPGGAPTPTDRKDRNDEPFWFMDGGGDLEGWDQTNPSEEWRKRHGVEDGNE
ncbi:MAG: hypothetical protein VX265_08615 [Myxococcota bacterium]|nr:hypothetical protein [Myxococcota bacterium]MEC8425729.1 hypothetical protein [Myxococcota bacterium]